MEAPQTPELNKMSAFRKTSQSQGEFVEWLATQGLVLCRWVEWEDAPAGYALSTERLENLLAQFHEIDLNKVEDERRALLEYLQHASRS